MERPRQPDSVRAARGVIARRHVGEDAVARHMGGVDDPGGGIGTEEGCGHDDGAAPSIAAVVKIAYA